MAGIAAAALSLDRFLTGLDKPTKAALEKAMRGHVIVAIADNLQGHAAYPLMHTSGSTRATLRARPAASAASTTAETSL